MDYSSSGRHTPLAGLGTRTKYRVFFVDVNLFDGGTKFYAVQVSVVQL
jgi:hypothetical protein